MPSLLEEIRLIDWSVKVRHAMSAISQDIREAGFGSKI